MGEALIRLGLLTEERLVAVFEQSLLVPRVSASALLRVPGEVVSILPQEMVQSHGVLPIELDAEGNLTLAMIDPTDNRAVDVVAAHTGRFVMRAVAASGALREAIRAHHRPQGAAPRAIKESGSRPKTRSGKNPLPPTASVVPEAAIPSAPAPGRMLAALVRAVSGGMGPTPAPTPAPQEPEQSGRQNKKPRTTQVPRRPSGSQETVPADREARSAAVTDREARSAAVTDREARSAAVTDRRPKTSKTLRKPQPNTPIRQSGRSVSDPILLDRPVRTQSSAGTTLPGVGAAASGVALSSSGPTGIDESLLAPVARLKGASDRDEVIAVLLDYASRLAARVGLFVVQKGQLICLDGRGPDHVVVAMKWFTIPVDTPSPFRDVLNSRVAYHGRLDDTAESRAFRNALGSSSKELLLLPLMVGDRAVGVLYADEIHTDLGQLSQELSTLSREAGAAFLRIILSSKRRPA